MHKSFYPVRAAKIPWRWDGEAETHITLIAPKTGHMYLLNPIAARIFFYCDGSHSIEEVVHKLLQDYNINRRQLELDVNLTLKKFHQLGLVKFDKKPLA